MGEKNIADDVKRMTLKSGQKHARASLNILN